METIRKVKNIELNKGIGMANGLFNLSKNNAKQLSVWFCEVMKEDLLKLNDIDFLKEAERIIQESNN